MIGPTLIALRGLPPSERRLLSHFCLLEAGSGRRNRESCRILRALSEACESLDGRGDHSSDRADISYLRNRLSSLSAERVLAIAQATTKWLDTASVDDLLDLVAQLRGIEHVAGNGDGVGPSRS